MAYVPALLGCLVDPPDVCCALHQVTKSYTNCRTSPHASQGNFNTSDDAASADDDNNGDANGIGNSGGASGVGNSGVDNNGDASNMLE